jgi:Zn-dependent protease
MFGKGVTLFELLGFEVKVDASWLFLALLIAWSLAKSVFPTFVEGFAPATYWWMGVAGVIGLFFSLVLHELAHSVVARLFGMRIRGITLFIFGGVAEMEDEPPSPRAEFVMALAGPAASIALAVGLYAFAAILDAGGLAEPLVAVARYLGMLNGVLAVFNMVPAFPLDGGRAFRAALWHVKGDLKQATRMASGVGAGFGMALMAFGVFNLLVGNLVGGVWLFLIGMFLRAAASASYQQLLTRSVLEGEPVRRFMTARPVTVPPGMSLLELVEGVMYRTHHQLYPVTEDGRLMGCVGAPQVKEVPRERWDDVRVWDVLERCSPENTIGANEDAVRALSRMRRTGRSRLMVTDRGRLVGIIALKDVLALLALKMDLEGLD